MQMRHRGRRSRVTFRGFFAHSYLVSGFLVRRSREAAKAEAGPQRVRLKADSTYVNATPAEVVLFAEVTAGGREMLYTLAVILLIAWLLGVVGTYTIGAFIHVLLVVALVLLLVGLLSGRRTIV